MVGIFKPISIQHAPYQESRELFSLLSGVANPLLAGRRSLILRKHIYLSGKQNDSHAFSNRARITRFVFPSFYVHSILSDVQRREREYALSTKLTEILGSYTVGKVRIPFLIDDEGGSLQRLFIIGQSYPRTLASYESITSDYVSFFALAPQKDIYRHISNYEYKRRQFDNRFPLRNALEAFIILACGIITAGYGWIPFRRGRLKTWVGLSLTSFGLALVCLGTAMFLSWVGDRIDNELLYRLQFADDFSREILGSIIHPVLSFCAKVALLVLALATS